ncbi:hypothetical protein K458DRAFT_480996 [Lentithecium fluviatile CBS 122367]|uniref:F-box domain-containing protein n=1 Tax=Lentithecium fluviatile CBS 122367 TaxID=1168545 RepID=A0A6G1IJN1_9PLEO|nr:hypothetical protein K458DRAFT_480996 [Lentithecium fluviatile CBS 122367]
MFFQLPVELQRGCIQCLDVEGLKSFRLVNKDALAIATETLFGTVNLLPTYDNAEKLSFVREDATLNPLVRRVIFNTPEDPLGYLFSGGADESELLDSFQDALLSVTKFSGLREVELRFAKDCALPGAWARFRGDVAETKEFRTAVLQAFFKGLAEQRELPVHVESLTIKNLQDGTDVSIYESDTFQAVRSRLKKLHLQIATENHEPSPEDNVDFEACQRYFDTELPEQWLKPLQPQLTYLTLYTAQCMWGFYPFCDLRRIHFPLLKSLALGNWTIVHEWQIDWLLSHGETLEELVLDDCPIVTALMMTDKQIRPHWQDLVSLQTTRLGTRNYFKEVGLRWHHVFPRLRFGLPRLLHFAMGSGNWEMQNMFEERYELLNKCLWGRYYTFNIGTCPTPWAAGDDYEVLAYARMRRRKDKDARRATRFLMMGGDWEHHPFPECDEEDLKAFRDLLDVVEKRQGVRV